MEILKYKLGKDVYGIIFKYTDQSYNNLIKILNNKYTKNVIYKDNINIIDIITMAVKKGYAGLIFNNSDYSSFDYFVNEIKLKNYYWIKQEISNGNKKLFILDDKKFYYINIRELDIIKEFY